MEQWAQQDRSLRLSTEQAWLAEAVPPDRRGWVYSLNSGMGFFGMGLGALIAVLPDFWRTWLSGAQAYRPLFGLVALAAVGNLLLLSRAREEYLGSKHTRTHRKQEVETLVRRQENLILTKLVLINSFNGLAIGLTGPLISYWFALRFEVGPAAIAPVMAATFVITGISSLLTGWLTGRIGIVTSVVWERLIGTSLLALLPLMPSYSLASLVFILRTVFYRGSSGAQQALTIGLVRNERRGFATSLNTVSFQLPRAAGPSISGYLLDAGQFSLPFYAAALLQLVYLVWYRRTFPKYEPPRSRTLPSILEGEVGDDILRQDHWP